MNMNMNKKEVILCAIIILLSLLGWIAWENFPSIQDREGKIAVIIHHDQVIDRINLDKVSEPREIILSGRYNEIILVEKGRIRFKEADCPDRICVNTGWLKDPGDMAVCLPNQAIVRIEAK